MRAAAVGVDLQHLQDVEHVNLHGRVLHHLLRENTSLALHFLNALLQHCVIRVRNVSYGRPTAKAENWRVQGS